jgi:hypothetical protein
MWKRRVNQRADEYPKEKPDYGNGQKSPERLLACDVPSGRFENAQLLPTVAFFAEPEDAVVIIGLGVIDQHLCALPCEDRDAYSPRDREHNADTSPFVEQYPAHGGTVARHDEERFRTALCKERLLTRLSCHRSSDKKKPVAMKPGISTPK